MMTATAGVNLLLSLIAEDNLSSARGPLHP